MFVILLQLLTYRFGYLLTITFLVDLSFQDIRVVTAVIMPNMDEYGAISKIKNVN